MLTEKKKKKRSKFLFFLLRNNKNIVDISVLKGKISNTSS